MAFAADDELLQDFLVEAGEILEQLNEQLVDLEQRPDDKDLLNAVFRGFHTVKGGASFLGLDPMVALCHRAEDVFNILRNGERQVDAQLMDVMLPVLDVLNSQFDCLRNAKDMPAAEPALLETLESMTMPGAAAAAPKSAAKAATPVAQPTLTVVATATAPASGDITDEEFERLLDAINPQAAAPAAKPAAPAAKPAGDEISDDEFENLLDELHGKGKHAGKPAADAKPAEQAKPAAKPSVPAGGNMITDDEFENLLDELHGKGKPAGKPADVAVIEKTAVKSVAPAAKPATDAGKEPPTAQAETTVRVDTKRLDDIMNMVGELVLVRNRLATLEAAHRDEEMSKVVGNLDVVTADLQAAVMKTRMQPIKKVFGRFPRVVRDLARSLKKEVHLEMQGEETDLDKNLVEALADPLVHLVRNAVDHGVESPDAREAAGKPRAGTVVLSAEQEGDHILLTIEDDGKGMDAEILRRKVVEKGLLDADTAARLDNKDCYNLIFMPGFSTKDEISDISGRGVGMDVVKTRIVQLNGSVEVDSELGKGSRIIIKVPLTLAIMPTLMVMLDKQIFALPLASVNEIFHLDLTRTNTVDGQLVVMIREKALPLFYLRHWLIAGRRGEALPREGHVVVVSIGTQKVGFVVDHLIGQEEVVIKPLGALLHGLKGLAGATITGDGRISLILDVPGLMQNYARRF